MAHALAGRSDEAFKLAKESCALQQARDQASFAYVRPVAMRAFLVLDRRDEAFALLRDMMSRPGPGSEELRLDPFWARVKGDPRFEEILKLAKPL